MKGETSALAVAEKRPQRSGGCVGVFFQLFNWNRRLAKKKKKELLPPVRAKRVSKKIGGHEKLPMAKLLLIADENRGGFPRTKKSETCSSCSLVNAERNDVMRTPGVVARLMGLESMPAVRRDKPKKGSGQGKKPAKHFDSHRKDSDLLSSDCDLNSEMGLAKANLRPQKLQKTGIFDRRPVKRLGAEALQLKNVLSSSKNQHRKLASPVKSMRVHSGRNASRLIEAATKILEPGLKETNRARCSLTSTASRNHSLKGETKIEGMAVKQSTQSSYPFTAKSSKGQSPRNSCGDFLDVTDGRPDIGEQFPGSASSASVFSNDFLYELGNSKLKTSVSSSEKEKNTNSQRPVILINQDRAMPLAAQARANVLSRAQNSADRKPHFLKEQDGSTSNRQSRPMNGLKRNTPRQNRMLLVKDEVLPGPKLSNRQSRKYSSSDAFNGDEDYTALNRNMNNRAIGTRMPTKALGYSKIDMERYALDRKDESSFKVRTVAQKIGPVNKRSVSPQVDNKGLHHSTFVNERNVAINGNGNWKGVSASSSKDASIVSFTFSSPMRHCTKISSSMELAEKQKCHGDGELSCDGNHHRKVISDARNGNSLPQRLTHERGDALSILIEQKIREISCLDADDLAKVDSLPGKATASILEELVSSLTAARPFSQVNGDESPFNFGSRDSLHCLDGSGCNSMEGLLFNTNTKFQADTKPKAFTRRSLPTDYDRHSPTSILDTSFSNDSCLSGSFDGSLGYSPPTERSRDLTLPLHPDADFSDSMMSMSIGMAGRKNLIDSIVSSSGMHGIAPAEIGTAGNKLNHVWEVISDIELLFENLVLYNADGMGDSLVESLLKKLETLADSLWRCPSCSLGFTESMKGNRLRGWLFDCVIEFFDSKYIHYCKSGFKAWAQLPLYLSIEKLTREAYEEIIRWTSLAGRVLDEKIEREMSSSLGKWTNFEVEVIETDMVIEEAIFQILLDELVTDLGECSVGCT